MKKKKLLSILLAASMVAGLAGCGSSSNGSAASSSGSSTAAQTATTAAAGDDSSAAPAGEYEETSDGKVKAPTQSGKLSVAVRDYGLMPSSEGTIDDNRWTKWIRENGPVADVTFDSIPQAEATETVNTKYASGTAPDLLYNTQSLMAWYQNGMLHEIDDDMLAKMPNYAAILNKLPILRKSGTVDGKMMFLMQFDNVAPNHTIVIRQDWLDNLGLDLPKTPEDLYNVIYAFTYNDPDGNGKDDTWGISMTTDSLRTLSHMYGFPNPKKYDMDENGQLYYVWDRIEDWLAFMKQIVDNGCCDPDFMTMTADDDQADFVNGKIGIYCTGRFMTNTAMNVWSTFKQNNPDGKLNTFPLPETKYGKFNGYLNGGPSQSEVISADVQDLDAACAYVDWAVSPDVYNYLKYGPDGTYYKSDEDGTRSVVNADKNATEYDYNRYYVLENPLQISADNPDGLSGEARHANDNYNRYLASDDSSMWELGSLIYKMYEIANDPDYHDPRKWLQDGLPALPDDLAAISATADKEVDDLLIASMGDSSKTAADAVAEAKQIWENAGGQKVDDYYNQYYQEMGDKALLAQDFIDVKDAPALTSKAKEHYTPVDGE